MSQDLLSRLDFDSILFEFIFGFIFTSMFALSLDRYTLSMAYRLMMDSGPVHVYCHMQPISGCGSSAGWTLVMKIDGSKVTLQRRTRFLFYKLLYTVYTFSKIKLEGYHQWRVLIGWATSRLSGVLQKTTVIFSESKLTSHFQTSKFPANKRTTIELENWKKKNCPNSVTERSSTEKSPTVAALLWERRDWTELWNL